MRINPYALKRPEAVTETLSFTDALSPGIDITLTLSAKAGFNAVMEINRNAADLIRDYVTGTLKPAQKEGEAPSVLEASTPLVIPGFGAFLPSEALCYCIAQLMYMQVPYEAEAPYDFPEWCIISETFPTAFGRISAWSDRLMNRANGTLKNEPGASTEA